MTETCVFCKKPARYIRHTQFSGTHPFCEEHGPQQKDFMVEDSYEFWEDIQYTDVAVNGLSIEPMVATEKTEELIKPKKWDDGLNFDD